MSKITKTVFFYKLKNFLIYSKPKNTTKLVYRIINNYYYSKLKCKPLVYVLKSADYIKFIMSPMYTKLNLNHVFLKKWFYAKISNWIY